MKKKDVKQTELHAVALEFEAMARQIRRHDGKFSEIDLSMLTLRLEWIVAHWPRSVTWRGVKAA
jgi:hypothetical protein